MRPVFRHLLIASGSISLALGVLGIFVPILPTTPFLLLAAACFVRSSERLHRWLLEHRHLGPYLRDFTRGEGVPVRTKTAAVLTLWASITVSGGLVLVLVGPGRTSLIAVAAMVACALGVTVYLTWFLPTRPKCSPE